jgi:hypothetical protein
MFEFIKNLFFFKINLLFSPSHHTETILVTGDPSTTEHKENVIPYNAQLITGLKAEHQELLMYYTRIMRHANNKQYTQLTLGLNQFSELLKSHLRKESIYLYMYLEFVIVKKKGMKDRKTFRDFRLEMKNISMAVSSAINLYINTPVTDQTVDQFIQNFTEIGNILVDRIKREEKNLYPIYLNHTS